MRFEDKISVTFDIDKDLDDINIPCFCVQTLVENAMFTVWNLGYQWTSDY